MKENRITSLFEKFLEKYGTPIDPQKENETDEEYDDRTDPIHETCYVISYGKIEYWLPMTLELNDEESIIRKVLLTATDYGEDLSKP